MNRLVLFLLAISFAFAQGSPDIVVSQVYGGGGNAGAPLRNDFIELFNRGALPVNVTGWSVQYGSATGADWQVTPLSGTIEPRRYYLVQQAAGANTAATALPSPDATGTIAMSGTAAKVALVRTATALTGATPSEPDIVDLVGYGAASAFEKAPTPALSNTTAALRRANGCVDSDDNSADFQTGTPRPRNSGAEPLASCDASASEALPLKISEVQGPGAESPVTGRNVSTRGVVTGRKSNGFFLQSLAEDDDGNPQTSEGIFVFTSTAAPGTAQVGSVVQVTGTVTEFRPAADLGSPPLTEIVSPAVEGASSGRPLPAPVELGLVADLESLEGMRVTVPAVRVVGPTGGSVSEANATANSNGVFYAVEEGGVRPFTGPSGALGSRLLRIDTRALGTPALDVQTGDTARGLTGPLDFGFRAYTIDTETPPLILSPTRPASFVPRAQGEFAVASMNLQRLFDTENDPGTSDPVLTTDAYQRRLVRTARAIRESLGAPEIIGVVEVESLSVLQALAREAGNYQAYLAEGNDIGGIDVGVLVRNDRVMVQSFAQEGKEIRLDDQILNDRPPVLLRATVDGVPVVIVVNHLRSLINADSPVVARKRRAQAEFLRALLRRESAENLISLGDYNMDQFDPLMQTITTSGLLNLTNLLRPNEAYTYVFDGVTQALDHILVSPSALRYLTRYQIAHLNADYPESSRNDASGANRISDHDVPIAYFAAAPPPLRFTSIGHAASYVNGTVAPSQWLTVFTPGPITTATAAGRPARIVSSAAQQTTLVLPAQLSPGVQPLVLGGSTINVPVSAAAPGIFTLSGAGRGPGAILNQDLTVNGAANPAPRGTIIALYLTGLNGQQPTTVWIGSTRAQVTYSGPAPGLPEGIQQVNALVPAEAPTGSEVLVLVASGDEVGAAGVTVAIR
ncbi:MAG TPA: lamin tail domain-containing protein [Bryobacteraceae bacterium]|nr:lamin tail domain-containing protein [Bryobacteraceae bacterium]